MGKLLIFEVKTLPLLQKGSGVQLIKLKDNDLLSDIKLFDLADGLFFVKRSNKRILKDIDFWLGKRAQSGKKIPKNFNKNLKFW